MKQHQIPHPWTDYNIAKNLDSPNIGRLWTGLIETYRRKCHSGLNLLVVELRNIVDGVIVVSHHFECNNCCLVRFFSSQRFRHFCAENILSTLRIELMIIRC